MPIAYLRVKLPESILSQNLIAVVDAAIEKARLASSVQHHGFAGELREIFLSNLIIPLLPDGYRVGTGKIIDRSGALSQQTDIIIYSRSHFTPLMFDERLGIFPIDSVDYAIEVKSTITHSEIRDSFAKAQKLRSLNGPKVNFVLFGFKSDLTTPIADLERMLDFQPKDSFPPISAYCCVGNGYCSHNGTKWDIWTSTERRAEVIGLLIGFANTLAKTSLKIPNYHPGSYLAWWE